MKRKPRAEPRWRVYVRYSNPVFAWVSRKILEHRTEEFHVDRKGHAVAYAKRSAAQIGVAKAVLTIVGKDGRVMDHGWFYENRDGVIYWHAINTHPSKDRPAT